jgi:NADPH-dependent FMN reductase
MRIVMNRIGIILGSTRPNRKGEDVANWVYDVAAQRDDADFELVDLRDYPLPHLDEPLSPAMRQYQHDHTKACGELMMADVRQQVALSLVTEWEDFAVLRPRDYNVAALHTLLDQVVAWSTALAFLRAPATSPVAHDSKNLRSSPTPHRAAS